MLTLWLLRGGIYRWDDVPNYPLISAFPGDFHGGDVQAVTESHLREARHCSKMTGNIPGDEI